MTVRQEDFLFAEHVLRRGFATEAQVEEGLQILEKLRGEMDLDDTLAAILVKKGYLAPAQANAILRSIDPKAAGRPRNQIEGYRLLARLGSGAMGSVYKAQHLKLNVPVALKVLRLDHAGSRTQTERLRREAHLAATLSHPNIVRSLDVGESNGFHYFAMELVEGSSVRDLLRRGRLKEADAIRIVSDVARALEHAHAHGVVHRDVKPGNIIVTEDGVVKLADFGLARGKGPSDLTLDTASIGTPQYLAPEQARRGSDATPRSDLFSLGASLYHMVTGRPAFVGENLGEVFGNVLRCRFAPPEQLVPDLSLDCVYVIHHLMRPNPKERYASASALLADLEKMRRGERVAPPEFRGDYREYLARRRKKRVLAAAGAACVLCAAGIIVFLELRASRQERERLAGCRAANAFLSGKITATESPDLLDEQVAQLSAERARAASKCRATELGALSRRLSAATISLASLRSAQKILEGAKGPDVDYQARDKQLAALRAAESTPFPGARRAIQKLRDELAEASRKDFESVWSRLHSLDNPATPKEMEASLAGLKADLETRYLPLDTKDAKAEAQGIPHEWQEFHTLRATWSALEGRGGDKLAQRFASSLKQDDYRDASRYLGMLLERKASALRAVREAGRLPAPLLRFFPDPESDPRRAQLSNAESAEEATVREKAAAKREAGRPDLALSRWMEFRARATDAERKRIQERISALQDETKNLLAAQNERVEEIDSGVRILTGGMRFKTASVVVQKALGDKNALGDSTWLDGPAKRLRDLADTMQRMSVQLTDRFLKRAHSSTTISLSGQVVGEVAGPSVRSADSKLDPDLLAATDKAGKPVPFHLSDVGLHALKKILGIGPGGDPSTMGYLSLAQAYAAKDPRKVEGFLKSAASELQAADDPWKEEVRLQWKDRRDRNLQRESEAQETYELFHKLMQKREYQLAYDQLQTLLSEIGYRFTNCVDSHWPELSGAETQLKRFIGPGMDFRDRAGVPARNFTYGDGVATVRFTFQRWSPYEGKAPDNEDKKEWLKKNTTEYWRDRYTAWKETEPFDSFYERATHQLLAFRGLLAGEDGCAYFPAAQGAENARAWMAGSSKALVPVELRDPFLVDHDWSLEMTVRWVPSAAQRTENGFAACFSIFLGRLNATLLVLDDRYPSKNDKRYGGGAGAGIFVLKEASTTDASISDVEERMQDFEAHRIQDRRHRKQLDANRSYLDGFPADTAVRIRLERKGSEARFFVAPLASWKKRGFVDKDLLGRTAHVTADDLTRACAVADKDGKNSFRILSLLGFRVEFRDVVLRGTLPQSNGGE